MEQSFKFIWTSMLRFSEFHQLQATTPATSILSFLSWSQPPLLLRLSKKGPSTKRTFFSTLNYHPLHYNRHPDQLSIYQSEDDGLTKCVRPVWHLYMLLRKSLLKLDRRKFSDCCYLMGHHRRIICFSQKLHTLRHTNIWQRSRQHSIKIW